MIPLFSEDDYQQAHSKDLLPCQCYFCQNTFYTKKVLITRERLKNENKNRFCNQKCLHDFRSIGKNFQTQCSHCAKPLTKQISEKNENDRYFCNASCSASYHNTTRIRTEEYRRNVSASLKRYNTLHNAITHKQVLKKMHIRKCSVCDNTITGTNLNNMRKTCSDSCRLQTFGNAGRKSASVRKLRSSDEIELFNLCQQHFTTVEPNKILFEGWDCDFLINDKYAVLWNGPWHYKDIKMKGVSLTQIENRDRIKTEKFFERGYIVLIYEDRTYSPHQAFEDLKKFIIQ